MSKLHKLGLMGFRSYGITEMEFIQEFFSPLTIIQGVNGSGKSTILEVLRYAIAGSYPPNSQNGRSFIREPSMENLDELKVCAFLYFQSVKKENIICKRSMRRRITKKKQFIDHLEQYLKLIKNNNEQSRVDLNIQKMDQVMPNLLGVSKAILENIILCHQDHSNWPFSENSILKQIFDQLFDTDKYSKFVEQTKKIVKDQQSTCTQIRHLKQYAQLEHQDLISTKRELYLKLQSLLNIKKEIEELKEKLKNHKKHEEISEIDKKLCFLNFQIEEIQKKDYLLEQELEFQDPKKILQISQQESIEREKEFLQKLNEAKDEFELFKNNEKNFQINMLKQNINEILSKLKVKEIRDEEFFDKEQIQIINKNFEQNFQDEKSKKNIISDKQQKTKLDFENFSNKSNEKLLQLSLELKDKQLYEKCEKAYEYKQEWLNLYQQKQNLDQEENQKKSCLKELQIKIDIQQPRVKYLQNCLLYQDLEEKNKLFKNIQQELEQEFQNLDEIKLFEKQKESEQIQKNEKLKELQKNKDKNIMLLGIKQKERSRSQEQNKKLMNYLENRKIKIKEQNPMEVYKKLKQKKQQKEIKINSINKAIQFFSNISTNCEEQKRCVTCNCQLNNTDLQFIQSNMQKKLKLCEQKLNKNKTDLLSIENLIDIKKQHKKQLQEFEENNKIIENCSNEIVELMDEKQIVEQNFKTIAEEEKDTTNKIKKCIEAQLLIINIEELQKQINENFEFRKIKIDDKFQLQKEIEELLNAIDNSKETIKSFSERLIVIEKEIFSNLKQMQYYENQVVKFGYENIESISMNESWKKKKQFEDCQKEIKEINIFIQNQKKIYQNQENQLNEEFLSNYNKIQLYEQILEKLEKLQVFLGNNNQIFQIKENIQKYSNLYNSYQITTKFYSLKNQKQDFHFQINLMKEQLKDLNFIREKLKEEQTDYESIKENLQQCQGKNHIIEESVLLLKDQVGQKSKTENELIFQNKKENEQSGIIEDHKIFYKTIQQMLVNQHMQKIKQVNQIIERIWQETYTEKDIQKILIHSELIEDEKKGRNFNYEIRFLTHKGEKLNLKENGSSGQKVLASIVIRLGLQEYFCQNCGFIALDEPTNYLDKQNSKSLSSFIKNLAEIKKEDKNFQMIIITHDKQFIEDMKELTSKYYQIAKDNNGYSHITLRDFNYQQLINKL